MPDRLGLPPPLPPPTSGRPLPPGLVDLEPYPRLSIPTGARILAAGASAFSVGMALGLAHGGKMAELRFRAEHAHRMPTSTTGWYLYHKSKNYRRAQGGLREGFRLGSRLGFWTALAFGLEKAVDHTRGRADFVSTVTATLAATGGFSLWNRFSLPMTAKMAKRGLAFGLAYGLAQDFVGWLRGRPIGYIDAIHQRLGPKRAENAEDERTP